MPTMPQINWNTADKRAIAGQLSEPFAPELRQVSIVLVHACGNGFLDAIEECIGKVHIAGAEDGEIQQTTQRVECLTTHCPSAARVQGTIG